MFYPSCICLWKYGAKCMWNGSLRAATNNCHCLGFPESPGSVRPPRSATVNDGYQSLYIIPLRKRGGWSRTPKLWLWHKVSVSQGLEKSLECSISLRKTARKLSSRAWFFVKTMAWTCNFPPHTGDSSWNGLLPRTSPSPNCHKWLKSCSHWKGPCPMSQSTPNWT